MCDHPGHMVENSWLGLGSIGDRPGHMSAGVGSMVVTLGEWYVTQLIFFLIMFYRQPISQLQVSKAFRVVALRFIVSYFAAKHIFLVLTNILCQDCVSARF